MTGFFLTGKAFIARTLLLIMLFAVMSLPLRASTDNAFFEALKKGDLPGVKALLQKNPELIRTRDSSGNSALHITAYSGNWHIDGGKTEKGGYVEIAALLIEKGIPASDRNNNDQTPLHFAAMNGNREITKYLLSRGADAKAKNTKGDTPLHMAAHGHSTAVAALILAAGAGMEDRNLKGSTPLHLATFINDMNMMSFFLSRGAQINALNNEGGTPLHTAAFLGDMECVRLLVEKGADKAIKNKKGETAADVTTDEEIEKYLRSRT